MRPWGIQAENLASMMASVTTSARMVGVVSFDLATINRPLKSV